MVLAAFLIALAFMVIAITRFKIHPFLAMLIGGILMGLLAGLSPTDTIQQICQGFGNTMADIGILIYLGVMLGELLHNSGATKNIAGVLLKKFGIKNTPLAICITGYLICIPVFMDAAFVILIDLVRQLSKQGRIALNVLVCALVVGLEITHSMVIPTPGPLAVAGTVGANIAWFIIYSLIVSFPSAVICGVWYGRWLGKKHPAWGNVEPVEVSTNVTLEKEENTAGGGVGIFLILLPIVLIILGTIARSLTPENTSAYVVIDFLSDTNIILLITVFIAYFMLRPHLKDSFEQIISTAADSVGNILAIIGAGGGFGAVISASGLGDFLVAALQSAGIPILVLAFLLAMILHSGLGSITVALVTTSAVVAPLIQATGQSPILVGLAVCAGGMALTLPTDSSFWTVNRFAGLEFGDTLRANTIPVTFASLISFGIILILNLMRGFLPGLY